jgi:hypothetical protein
VAYSNYGGFVFRDGERMPGYEDAVLIDSMYHVILGNGRVRLCGYKSWPVLFVDGKEVSLAPYTTEEGFPGCGQGEIDGYKFGWEQDDDPEKVDLWLKEPDGTMWTGFSGYAMGAGWWD